MNQNKIVNLINRVLKSNGKLVLITDADLSASIDQFITLYNKYLDGFDIVIAIITITSERNTIGYNDKKVGQSSS